MRDERIGGFPTTVVRACVRRGRGGSPTVVADDHPAATDADRLALPGLAGTSHAAFVSRDRRADGSRAVRFFTGRAELANCGHGTIAAQAVLLVRHGATELRTRQHTGGRTFEVAAKRSAQGGALGVEVSFDQGFVELRQPTDEESGAVRAALGLRASDLHPDVAPIVASPGTPRHLLPVRDREVLLSISPGYDAVAAVSTRFGYLGCFAYVPPSSAQPAAGRMFAPAIAVLEDVTNANSAGCLAAHLLASTGAAAVEIEVDQGDALGRPGRVFATATVSATTGAPSHASAPRNVISTADTGPAAIRVRVGGVAVVPA